MSSPEVTITLGRIGQVVKRKWGADQSSVRERLGNHGGAGTLFSSGTGSKRKRGISISGNLGNIGENEVCLDGNDLRYNLIRKRLSRECESHAAGASERRAKLRRELSGAFARSSNSSNVLRQDSQVDERIFLKVHSRETARDLPYMDSEYNSAFSRHNLKQKSSARHMRTCHSLSPPTYGTNMQKVPSMRMIDATGVRRVLSNQIPDPSRSAAPARIMMLTASETCRPLNLFTAPTGIMPRSPFMAEAHMTVPGLLNSLGLDKYAIYFQAEEVDMLALRQMGEKDLKDLGIPMGPRKKILQALSALFKRPLLRQL